MSRIAYDRTHPDSKCSLDVSGKRYFGILESRGTTYHFTNGYSVIINNNIIKVEKDLIDVSEKFEDLIDVFYDKNNKIVRNLIIKEVLKQEA